MVLQPGRGFPVKKSTENPVQPTGNPVLSAAKPVSQAPTKQQGVQPASGVSTQEKGEMP